MPQTSSRTHSPMDKNNRSARPLIKSEGTYATYALAVHCPGAGARSLGAVAGSFGGPRAPKAHPPPPTTPISVATSLLTIHPHPSPFLLRCRHHPRARNTGEGTSSVIRALESAIRIGY